MGLQATREHELIRRWVLARGGAPARVRGSEGVGLLFGQLTTTLVPCGWEEFFRRFEEGEMTFHFDPSPASRRYRIEWPREDDEEEDG